MTKYLSPALAVLGGGLVLPAVGADLLQQAQEQGVTAFPDLGKRGSALNVKLTLPKDRPALEAVLANRQRSGRSKTRLRKSARHRS